MRATGAAIVSVCIAIVGCAGSLESHVDDVRETVATRTGRQVRPLGDADSLDVEVPEEAVRLLARPLDAASAVQVALLTNRRIDAAYEEVGVGRGSLVQATLLRNPHAEGELLFHGDDSPSATLEVTQSLQSVLTLPWRSGAADAELDAVKHGVVGRVLDLALSVRQALVRHVADRQIAALSRSALEATEASAEAARLLHEAGNITDLQLARERVVFEEARIAVSDADARAFESREELQALLGLPALVSSWTTITRLPEPPGADEPGDLPRVASRALEASVDLAEARARIRASGRRLGLARVDGLIPELAVGVAYERHGDETGIGPRVELTVPLFDAGYGRTAMADAELRRWRHTYVALSIDVRAAARTARSRLLATRARALWARDSLVPLRRQILEQTLLEHNAMQAGVFELLAARRGQLDAERTHVEALRDYWIARARFEQVVAGRIPRDSMSTTAEPTSGRSEEPSGGHR